jgi:hypothetical protein
MSSESEVARRRLDAERVTLLAEGFLSRLGYKRATIRPKKASLEGEKYMVEVEVKKRTATVQVDLATGEIKGYQFEENQETSGFPLSRNTILILAGVAAVVAVVLGLKFMGFF